MPVVVGVLQGTAASPAAIIVPRHLLVSILCMMPNFLASCNAYDPGASERNVRFFFLIFFFDFFFFDFFFFFFFWGGHW